MKGISVAYLGTFTQMWTSIALELKQKYGWNPALYLGDAEFAEGELNSLPVISLDCLRRGIMPPDSMGLELRPPDHAILKALAPYEAIFFEGMTRYLVGHNAGTSVQRRQLYLRSLAVQIAIIKRFDIRAVITVGHPHRYFDHLLQQLCKILGVAFLAPDHTEIDHLGAACFSPNEYALAIRAVAEGLEANATPQLPQTGMAIERVRADYERGRPTNMSLKSFNSAFQRARRASIRGRLETAAPLELAPLLEWLRVALKGKRNAPVPSFFAFSAPWSRIEARGEVDIARTGQWKHHWLQTARNLRYAYKFYESRKVKVDWDTPFVLFSANVMPERSTVPDARLFNDFALIIDIMHSSVPKNWNIYYKEHPHSFKKPCNWANPHTMAYYERLVAVCPRLKFIGSDDSPFDLIDAAKAIVVGRGTMGWEALVRGTPVLLFGDCWYQEAPGVWRISSLADAKGAIAEIEAGWRPDEESLQRYMAALELVSTDMYFYFRHIRTARGNVAGDPAPPTPEELGRLTQSLYDAWRRQAMAAPECAVGGRS